MMLPPNMTPEMFSQYQQQLLRYHQQLPPEVQQQLQAQAQTMQTNAMARYQEEYARVQQQARLEEQARLREQARLEGEAQKRHEDQVREQAQAQTQILQQLQSQQQQMRLENPFQMMMMMAAASQMPPMLPQMNQFPQIRMPQQQPQPPEKHKRRRRAPPKTRQPKTPVAASPQPVLQPPPQEQSPVCFGSSPNGNYILDQLNLRVQSSPVAQQPTDPPLETPKTIQEPQAQGTSEAMAATLEAPESPPVLEPQAELGPNELLKIISQWTKQVPPTPPAKPLQKTIAQQRKFTKEESDAMQLLKEQNEYIGELRAQKDSMQPEQPTKYRKNKQYPDFSAQDNATKILRNPVFSLGGGLAWWKDVIEKQRQLIRRLESELNLHQPSNQPIPISIPSSQQSSSQSSPEQAQLIDLQSEVGKTPKKQADKKHVQVPTTPQPFQSKPKEKMKPPTLTPCEPSVFHFIPTPPTLPFGPTDEQRTIAAKLFGLTAGNLLSTPADSRKSLEGAGSETDPIDVEAIWDEQQKIRTTTIQSNPVLVKLLEATPSAAKTLGSSNVTVTEKTASPTVTQPATVPVIQSENQKTIQQNTSGSSVITPNPPSLKPLTSSSKPLASTSQKPVFKYQQPPKKLSKFEQQMENIRLAQEQKEREKRIAENEKRNQEAQDRPVGYSFLHQKRQEIEQKIVNDSEEMEETSNETIPNVDQSVTSRRKRKGEQPMKIVADYVEMDSMIATDLAQRESIIKNPEATKSDRMSTESSCEYSDVAKMTSEVVIEDQRRESSTEEEVTRNETEETEEVPKKKARSESTENSSQSISISPSCVPFQPRAENHLETLSVAQVSPVGIEKEADGTHSKENQRNGSCSSSTSSKQDLTLEKPVEYRNPKVLPENSNDTSHVDEPMNQDVPIEIECIEQTSISFGSAQASLSEKGLEPQNEEELLENSEDVSDEGNNMDQEIPIGIDSIEETNVDDSIPVDDVIEKIQIVTETVTPMTVTQEIPEKHVAEIQFEKPTRRQENVIVEKTNPVSPPSQPSSNDYFVEEFDDGEIDEEDECFPYAETDPNIPSTSGPVRYPSDTEEDIVFVRKQKGENTLSRRVGRADQPSTSGTSSREERRQRNPTPNAGPVPNVAAAPAKRPPAYQDLDQLSGTFDIAATVHVLKVGINHLYDTNTSMQPKHEGGFLLLLKKLENVQDFAEVSDLFLALCSDISNFPD